MTELRACPTCAGTDVREAAAIPNRCYCRDCGTTAYLEAWQRRPAEDELLDALEGMKHEWEKFSRYVFPIAKASNKNVQRMNAALAKYRPEKKP